MSIKDFFSNKKRFYPLFETKNIKNPNRWLSFPILGFVFKGIVLIPVFIELVILGIIYFICVILLNPFVILFTGKYWNLAYELNVGVIKLGAKVYYYFAGLTNQYPWFNLEIKDDLISLKIEKPKNPNRVLNFPILGFIVKAIALIPIYLVMRVVSTAAQIAFFFTSFVIFFTARYPESSYEINRDYLRLDFATGMYLTGLSDTYPSMFVSLNHKKIKIFLLILGFIFSFMNITANNRSNYHYQNTGGIQNNRSF